ncbi:MAG: flagellar export chaperone FlgN [Ignavibacteriales bacterium]|nr:flagellar export chaperone FlgN [Ignavibacteriales bacterium]
MNAQLLVNSLRQQDNNLDNLIEVLEEEKFAIVQNDYNALEQVILKEQKVLKTVEREESNRIKIIKEIASLYSLELSSPSVENLLEHGKSYLENEMKDLTKLRETINLKLDKIAQANLHLKTVIEFSRNMIKETVLMLVGPNKHKLVNKRV